VMISPYAYDYDLPILGVGMALLLPDLTRLASGCERAAIYSMTLIATFSSLLQAYWRLKAPYETGVALESRSTGYLRFDMIEDPILAFSGFALVVLLWLILRVLLRGAGELRLERQQAAVQTIEH
jgi:hypothetical protein